ncbi:hypothetical protein PRUPE_4G049900 [Prunus persica]|uniref:Peroxisomal membrane protein PMP22 n=1 Tax=Prunus persica TaxID=3760 RepID=A0A251PG02_PRUPE|nr:hypothetical protein PRUPE_4G049900 [Prunus persica]
MGSIAKKGLQQYLLQHQHHRLRTKVKSHVSVNLTWVVCGVLSAIRDIVSRKLTGIQKRQLRRLLLEVLFGAVYHGPFGHFLHLLLDKIFKGKKDSKTVAKKFWPVLGWINHQYVPLHLRVVFHSLVAFGWGIFLNLQAIYVALPRAK